MGAKFLEFTQANGSIWFLNNFIFFAMLAPLIIWECYNVNKRNWTPVLHSVVFGVVCGICLWVLQITGLIAAFWWTLAPAAFLAAVLREVYSKMRYNDFGWDDIWYSMIGTIFVVATYWLMN